MLHPFIRACDACDPRACWLRRNKCLNRVHNEMVVGITGPTKCRIHILDTHQVHLFHCFLGFGLDLKHAALEMTCAKRHHAFDTFLEIFVEQIILHFRRHGYFQS